MVWFARGADHYRGRNGWRGVVYKGWNSWALWGMLEVGGGVEIETAALLEAVAI
jgi:hypothetical protein